MFVRDIVPAILAVVVLAASAAPLMAERRTWTDNTGKHSVEAELVHNDI